MNLRSFFKEKEFWILILLGILFFHRPLFFKETLFFRDLFGIFLPQKQLLANFMKAGEIPLWDPYLQGGRPYLAQLLYSPLYPSNLLYFFVPFLKAFNWNIILHFLWCLTSAYLFSRVIGLHPVSSFIVGGMYGFCGYTLSLSNLLHMILAMAHLPLLFLFWHLFLGERKRKWFIMAVIVGCLLVLAGSPEITSISFLSLLGWTLVYPYSSHTLPRKALLWFFLAIFVMGVTSIQLLPAIEMVIQSSRGSGLSYEAFTQWSLYPERLPAILFPEFLGRLSPPLHENYWGNNLVDTGLPCIISIYFGCVAIALACFGGLHKGDNKILPFRVRLFFISLFVVFLLLSLGRFLPFFHALFMYVPFISWFRYPIKFLSGGVLPLALLVGYATEVYFQGSTPGSGTGTLSRKVLGIFWGISFILGVFAGLFLLADDFASHFLTFIFKQPAGDVMRHRLGTTFTQAFIVWFAVTLLFLYRRLRKTPWQHWLLAGIILADILSAGRHVIHSAPEEFLTTPPYIVQVIRRNIGDGKLFRAKDPSTLELPVFSENLIWMYRWGIEVLNVSTAVFFRIPVIFHVDYDRMTPVYIMHLQTLIESFPWNKRIPILSASGVTLIVTSEAISHPAVKCIRDISNWSDVRFYVCRNENAVARVEFLTSWKEVRSDAEALGSMLNPDYDPRKYVILQKPASTFSQLFSKKRTVNDRISLPINIQDTKNVENTGVYISSCDGAAQFQQVRSSPNSAVYTGTNDCDGYFVSSEPYYPGWQVEIDGKPVPILRANYAFSAIFLPAGYHEIKRYYRPLSVIIGTLLSLSFCVVLLFLMYKGWLMK